MRYCPVCGMTWRWHYMEMHPLYWPFVGESTTDDRWIPLCLSHIQPRAQSDFLITRTISLKTAWNARRNLTSVLFSWSHQATGPVRRPYGHVRDNQNRQKPHTGVARRAPYGPRTGCSWYLNPCGARKLIMHALKLYGPRTGRQNSYCAARGPRGPRAWTYDS